jgi:hypothetical protein
MKIYYDAEVDALYIEFHPLADGTAEARPLSDELIAKLWARWEIGRPGNLGRWPSAGPGRRADRV